MKNILLVEDDNFLREIYEDVLRADGFHVEIAVNGNQAYEMIKRGGWDLVLLDIVMPDISGLEVIKKINMENYPVLKKTIVFLSNSDNPAEIKEAMELGNGYIIKSKFDPDQLVTEIKKFLSD